MPACAVAPLMVNVAFGSVTFTVNSVLSGIASVTPPVHASSPPVHFSIPRPKTRLPSSAAASRSAAEEAVSRPPGLELASALPHAHAASKAVQVLIFDMMGLLKMNNWLLYYH